MRRPEVKTIVVGTPLFVRQIEERPTGSTLIQRNLIASRKKHLLQVASIYDLEGRNKNQKRIDALVLTLHRLGFRVAEGHTYSSGFYLPEYRRTGRWDKALILYRPERRELGEQVQSFVDENSGIPSELLSIDEVIAANGPPSAELMEDDADVTVLVCSD